MNNTPWSEGELAAISVAELNTFEKWCAATGNPNKRTQTAWRLQRYQAGLSAHTEAGLARQEKALPEEELDEPTEHRLKTQVRQLKADKKRLLIQTVWTEDVVSAIAPHIPQMRNIPIVAKASGSHEHKREMILMLSDMHSHAKVPKDEVGGLAEYDSTILRQRAEELVQRVASIQRQHGGDIARLNLFVGGDLIEGQAVFPGQHRQIDARLTEQIVKTVEVIAGIVTGLLASFEEIHIYDVSGNHGRVTFTREAASANENFDWLVMQFVKVATQSCGDRLVWHPSEAWFRLIQRMGFRFLLIHGHWIRSWGGTPQNAILNNASKFFQLITANLPPDVTGPGFHYMLLGHFHTRAWMESTAFEVFVNGAWPGGSQYSIDQLKSSSRPAQLLLVLHGKHGVMDAYPIYLADRSELPTVVIDTE